MRRFKKHKREILIAYESTMLLLISISLATIFIRGETPRIFDIINTAVWVIFLIDVGVRLYRAFSRWSYIKKHPFDLISIIPLEDFFLLARFGRLIQLFRYKNLIKRYLTKILSFGERLSIIKVSLSVILTLIIVLTVIVQSTHLELNRATLFALRSFFQFNYEPGIKMTPWLYTLSISLKIAGVLYIGLIAQHVWRYVKTIIDKYLKKEKNDAQNKNQ